ncbi:integrase arm-type DNA-binding domain-containing protein [Shewanella profunda]|uniref:tyrosine-type recombinase/integrase n=1 Tax=Shewanella profunda TaxID=254793 RepID=UPI00200CE72B|nr:site-specific integrase [Shewanella profunda]MCL1091536.1 integrase arm-type DNA-binding domain-containing protein [Shewanella profunda]
MAGKNKLTDTALKKLLSDNYVKAVTQSDGLGLSIRARPSKVNKQNNLNWLFRYRIGDRTTSPHTIVLGNYPDLTLAKARDKRDECRAWLADGKDPKFEIALAIDRTIKPITVEDALNFWIDEYALDKRTNAIKHRQQFNKWLVPELGHLPLASIQKPHWIKTIRKSSKQYPVAAGYVLRNLQQALKFCAKRGYEIDRSVFDIELDDIGAKKQNKRSQRLVEDDSWQRLEDLVKWLDAGKMMPYYRNLTLLLISFGCRTQELRLAQTKEFNFDTKVWTVPAAHNKTRDKDQAKGQSGEIKRPIPDALIPMLKSLCEQHKGGYLLGELKSAEAVSGWGGKIYKLLGHDNSWSLHDLRRTVATGLNDMGIAPHVVEALLGHSIQGVAGIYNRSQYLPEKLDALNTWQDRLALLRGDTNNVVMLGRANEKF